MWKAGWNRREKSSWACCVSCPEAFKRPFLAFENKTLGRLNRVELGCSSPLEAFFFKDKSISRSMLGSAFSYLGGALEQCCRERDGQQWHVSCSGRVPTVTSFASTEEQGIEVEALRCLGLEAQPMHMVWRDAWYFCSVQVWTLAFPLLISSSLTSHTWRNLTRWTALFPAKGCVLVFGFFLHVWFCVCVFLCFVFSVGECSMAQR